MPTSLMDKQTIEQLIPHAGTMVLLDEVIHYDEHSLRATTKTHRDVNHPLRHEGQLLTLNLIEYAAQAMAVHLGVMASDAQHSAGGYLVQATAVKLYRQLLDEVIGMITIEVTRAQVGIHGGVYLFSAREREDKLACGRLSVFFKGGQ